MATRIYKKTKKSSAVDWYKELVKKIKKAK